MGTVKEIQERLAVVIDETLPGPWFTQTPRRKLLVALTIFFKKAQEDGDNKFERVLQQAQMWAMEAKTQRSTVHEIYQAVTGKHGEPGDWNGAQPVIDFIAQFQAQEERVCERTKGKNHFGIPQWEQSCGLILTRRPQSADNYCRACGGKIKEKE